ncbi:sporulation protein YunB [Aminipila butyrica]|uniref:Sporulation protein YunB n=1 Tax=Aminipila butyrica TaxID=433296 RepID=A0A858C0Q1_9FIRM|nr:sporulation protein YunB [Aminipila butyrica]QIB69966.1 sporulation protein YunB [Aminipila butyrica]
MLGWRSSKRFKACEKKKRGWLSWILVLLLFSGMAGGLGWKVVKVVQPSIQSLAEIKAKEMVTYAINEATFQQFFKDSSKAEELLIINTDQEGSIELVQSNTIAMNILAAELGKEIKQRYREMEPTTMKVPLGTILGSQLMSQADLYVDLKVLPISVANIEFLSEFESQGINQTKYKVYLSLTSKVKIMAPFSSRTMEVRNVVLVSEAVILGKVPNSYVNVPKEEILDGMNSGDQK